MQKYVKQLLDYPLFFGVKENDMVPMLNCLGGKVKKFKKGEYIFFEQDDVRQIGIIISGSVDMVKEDIWGNKTMLVRMKKEELFGETFSCGLEQSSVVSFCTSSNSEILFLPFDRVMHSCSMTCVFHHRLIENMVAIIARKNKQLMEKVEVISKKSLREKIMTYLSQQAQKQGTKYFEVPLGRVEMADFLCTDRSALTRELNIMREEGLIDFDKNMFQIL